MADEKDQDAWQELQERRKEASDHQDGWREEARTCYEYVAGDQWSDDDKARLEETKRPCATFNRIGPIIDSVVGYEVNNRRETTYLPRGLSDAQITETLNAAARFCRDKAMAEDEENDAFRDMLICGLGVVETHIDDERDMIAIERVPPLEMRWDPAARKQNLEDCNWMIREKWLGIDEVNDLWPDAVDEALVGMDSLGDQHWSGIHNATNAWRYNENQRSSWYDESENKVLIGQYQYRLRETVIEVGDPESGRIVKFTPERWNRIKDRINAPYRERTVWKYYQCTVAGPTVLEEGPIPCFSFRFITGKREESEGVFYGIVRAMLSPQQWSNVFFSTAMAALQSNAKGGLMIEESATNDLRDLADKWASPDGIVVLNDGAITSGAIREKGSGAGYPPALDNLMRFAIDSIRETSGVNVEMLGAMGTASNAAQLEMERKQSALTVLAPYFSALKRYRKAQGGDLLKLMRLHLSPGQVLRITDTDPAMWWRDPGAAEFDVIVDDAPSSPNKKQEIWASLQNILPAYLRTGMPLPPDLLRYLPLPESVANGWIQYIEQQQQMPDMGAIQQQAEAMQAELGKLQQENMQLKDKREAEAARLQQKSQEAMLDAQIKQQEMALEARMAEQQLMHKMQMSDADRAAKLLEIEARYDTEMTRIRAQADVQRENSERQVDSQREQAVISLHAEREKREHEREERHLEQMNPHVEQIERTSEEVQKVSEEWKEHAAEMAGQRKMVLDFLKQRGGEVGQLARQLDK